MILKGFNKKKQEELSYSFEPTEEQLKPRVLSTLEQIKAMSLRPETKGSGDPSELPPYVIFVRGTPEAFAQLTDKNDDTLYFISEEGETKGSLYLGDKLIASSVSTVAKLDDLADVLLTAGINPDSLLVYENGFWKNKELKDIAADFSGATEVSSGDSGLVPSPSPSDRNRYLKGDGTWDTIDSEDVDLDLISNLDIYNMMKED